MVKKRKRENLMDRGEQEINRQRVTQRTGRQIDLKCTTHEDNEREIYGL